MTSSICRLESRVISYLGDGPLDNDCSQTDKWSYRETHGELRSYLVKFAGTLRSSRRLRPARLQRCPAGARRGASRCACDPGRPGQWTSGWWSAPHRLIRTRPPRYGWTSRLHSHSPAVTTTVLHPFDGLFSRTTWVSRYQKSKTSPDLDEAGDDGFLGFSGIN